VRMMTRFIELVLSETLHSIVFYISLIGDSSVTTDNLVFLSYWYRRKRLQIRF